MDLWDLVTDRQQIDPEELAESLRLEALKPNPDHRTRVLMWESAKVLRMLGHPHVEVPFPFGEERERFPKLRRRVRRMLTADTIRNFLREVGRLLNAPATVIIGGASALILQEYLQRSTHDVDLVDEVPEPLRSLGSRLRQVQATYDLQVAHFQSHYLPPGWRNRLLSQGSFGKLEVYLVEGLDVAAGKLFSRREKDAEDLHYMSPRLERESLCRRAGEIAAKNPESAMLEAARTRWYVLYGEQAPW